MVSYPAQMYPVVGAPVETSYSVRPNADDFEPVSQLA